MSNKIIIHLVGCDGCGKSTIHNNLRSELPNVTYTKEPAIKYKEKLDVNNAIEYFAKDRHNLYNELNASKNNVIISDRSYICSLVYQSLELEKEKILHFPESIYHIYDSQLSVNLPSMIFYIHCSDPYKIQKRLSTRKYETDDILTITQINAIQSRYLAVFKLMNYDNIVIPIDTSTQPISYTISQIISHIKTII